MQQRADLFSLSFSMKDETSGRELRGVGREPDDPLAPLAEESEQEAPPKTEK